MPRRKWIKLWTQETLYRSISQELAPEERWVWIAFLCLAGDSVEPGVIMAAPDIAWTQEQLAAIVKVSLPVMQSAIAKMVEAKKIEVNHGGLIHIINWTKYQTDWDRIRKYPSQSPKDKPTPAPTTSPTPHIPTTKPYNETLQQEEKRGEGRGGGASSLKETSSVKVSSPTNVGDRTPRKKTERDPRVGQIFKAIEQYLGFPDKTDKNPIPTYGAEGQHIKTMLSRHFEPDEIITYWKKRIDAANNQYISAHFINQDIGKEAIHAKSSIAHREPKQYTPSKPIRPNLRAMAARPEGDGSPNSGDPQLGSTQ